MKRTPLYAFMLLGFAVLLVPAIIWVRMNYEQVDRTVDLPPRGEASYNPLYALQEALRVDGVTAVSRARLNLQAMDLKPGDTVVLLEDPNTLNPIQAKGLLDWVSSGGHLMLRTPPTLDFGVDADGQLLDTLGVIPNDESGCEKLVIPGEEEHVEFCRGQRFVVHGPTLLEWGSNTDILGSDPADDVPEQEPEADHQATADAEAAEQEAATADASDASSEDDACLEDDTCDASDDEDYDDDTDERTPVEGLVFARVPHGKGVVDVLADMDFMRNTNDIYAFGSVEDDKRPASGLEERQHMMLARLLLQPNYGKGTVHLVYASDTPSLWRRAFQQGWPVWVPLLLALLAWLWRRAQRFGSLRPSPAEDRRSLIEHVRASGDLLLRFGRAPLLYDAVRRAFLARLRRRAPVAANLQGDEQIKAIASLLQWPHVRVRDALHPPASNDVAGLRDRIRLLIQMRNLL